MERTDTTRSKENDPAWAPRAAIVRTGRIGQNLYVPVGEIHYLELLSGEKSKRAAVWRPEGRCPVCRAGNIPGLV